MTIAPIASGVPNVAYQVTWEKLPDDYPLPDDPVENTSQPLLAAALRESLELGGLLASPTSLAGSNLGLCATVSGKTVVKAPDWFYVHRVLRLDPPRSRRSYTPHTEGEVPAIVMEFLSDTDGGEYSSRPYPPYGKLWFYECILQVPLYVIFEPDAGTLEVRQLTHGQYQLQEPDVNGRYWLPILSLYFGVWSGTKADRTGFWLRWWDADGNLLLWGAERLEQERLCTEQERQRAEQLATYLRNQGIDPETIVNS
jgi:Uma2 family endonuclease